MLRNIKPYSNKRGDKKLYGCKTSPNHLLHTVAFGKRDADKKWVNETEKTTKIIILKFAYFYI